MRKFCCVICVLFLTGVHAQENPTPSDPALDLYYGANGLYNRNLYPVAVQQYRQFLEKYPQHEKALSARTGLGLSLYASGAHAEALPIL